MVLEIQLVLNRCNQIHISLPSKNRKRRMRKTFLVLFSWPDQYYFSRTSLVIAKQEKTCYIASAKENVILLD